MSVWRARLKEHKGVPSDIKVHLGGENLKLAYPPRVPCLCGWILDRSCKEAANQKSHAHKSWERWIWPWSVVSWGSLQHYWCNPSCTWCSNETVADMWTTSEGDHSATSLVSVWTVGVGGLCEWLSPSPKCNASIVDKLAQWNTSLCHKWDASKLCRTMSHYDMPLDALVE